MDISLDQLWQMEMDQLKLEQGREPDPDLWRWSPLDIYEFDIMLHIAVQRAHDCEFGCMPMDHGQLSIAEAGSGIGTKLYLARNKYGLGEMGYEINDEYLAKSAELGVIACKWDLSDEDNQPTWSAYDIVYAARPFKDDVKEHRWEQSVCKDMRPGAMFISAFASYKPYDWPCFYRRPFRGIWRKPSPGDEPPRTLARVQQFVTTG